MTAEQEPESADDDEERTKLTVTHGCGFVDADHGLASTVDSREDPEQARHWLLDGALRCG
ncbi:hypothetical protein GCM10023238_18590 [Streptomyces heliomycini]